MVLKDGHEVLMVESVISIIINGYSRLQTNYETNSHKKINHRLTQNVHINSHFSVILISKH